MSADQARIDETRLWKQKAERDLASAIVLAAVKSTVIEGKI
jgi:hypothetical protein